MKHFYLVKAFNNNNHVYDSYYIRAYNYTAALQRAFKICRHHDTTFNQMVQVLYLCPITKQYK